MEENATTVVARAATEEDAAKQPRVGSVHAMAAFIASLAAADADGRVLIERPGPGESSASGSDGGRLKYVLLDSAARFRQVVDEARAVVLVGGTLAPIPELARQLFPNARSTNDEVDEKEMAKTVDAKASDPDPSPILIRLPIPIRLPILRRRIGNPPASADVSQLRARRSARVSPPHRRRRRTYGSIVRFFVRVARRAEMMDELGRLVASACAVVPGGVVVFFPSFKYADDADRAAMGENWGVTPDRQVQGCVSRASDGVEGGEGASRFRGGDRERRRERHERRGLRNPGREPAPSCCACAAVNSARGSTSRTNSGVWW